MSSYDLRTKRPFLVIMPTWNRWDFTRESIKSLLTFSPFNLIESFVVFDNCSVEIDHSFLDSNFIPVITGSFPNANYCLNSIKFLSIPTHVKYLVKIDNDICITLGFFQMILHFFDLHQDAGTVFFAKNGETDVNPLSSPHGGVFATRIDLFSWFGNFPVSGKYPGCENYHRYVLNKGFKLYSVPDIAYDLSYRWTSLVDAYVEKGWMRRPV